MTTFPGIGSGPASIPSPMARMEGAIRVEDGATEFTGRKLLGIGTRRRGSESTATPIWGLICVPARVLP
jgi:hypothetical protein